MQSAYENDVDKANHADRTHKGNFCQLDRAGQSALTAHVADMLQHTETRAVLLCPQSSVMHWVGRQLLTQRSPCLAQEIGIVAGFLALEEGWQMSASCMLDRKPLHCHAEYDGLLPQDTELAQKTNVPDIFGATTDDTSNLRIVSLHEASFSACLDAGRLALHARDICFCFSCCKQYLHKHATITELKCICSSR